MTHAGFPSFTGGEELIVRVRVAEDAPLPRQLDLSGLMRCAVVIERDGVLVARFPFPFDDLIVTTGELLTKTKVSRLHQAWIYFCAKGS